MSDVSFEEPLSRDDVLEHFGIKGMHWGVWNEETRARRMGGKGRQGSKKLDEAGGSGGSSVSSDAKDGKQPGSGSRSSVDDIVDHEAKAFEDTLPDYYEHINTIEKYSNDYKKDEDRWIRLAVECVNVQSHDGKMTEDDKQYYESVMKNGGDLNQGTNNSYSLYLHETGKTEKFYEDYHRTKDKYEKNLSERTRKIEEAVGEKDSGLSGLLKDSIDEQLWDSLGDSGMRASEFAYEVANVEGAKAVDLDVLAQAKKNMGWDRAKHSALDDDEYLEHYGVKGMHWGVWNAETRARRLGSAKKAARKVGSAAKKAGSATARRVGEAHAKNSAARAIKAEATRRQRQFDRETRKAYGLSAKKYKKLRNATLKTHDPEKIAKGMHLLTDEELNAKIARMQREDLVRASANKLAKDRAKAKQEKAEAWNKSVPGKLVNVAIDKGVTTLVDKSVSAVVGKGVVPYLERYAGDYAKKGIAALDAKAKDGKPISDRKDLQVDRTSGESGKKGNKKKSSNDAAGAMNRLEALSSSLESQQRAERQAAEQHYKQVADAGARRVAELHRQQAASKAQADAAMANLKDLGKAMNGKRRRLSA